MDFLSFLEGDSDSDEHETPIPRVAAPVVLQQKIYSPRQSFDEEVQYIRHLARNSTVADALEENRDLLLRHMTGAKNIYDELMRQKKATATASFKGTFEALVARDFPMPRDNCATKISEEDKMFILDHWENVQRMVHTVVMGQITHTTFANYYADAEKAIVAKWHRDEKARVTAQLKNYNDYLNRNFNNLRVGWRTSASSSRSPSVADSSSSDDEEDKQDDISSLFTHMKVTADPPTERLLSQVVDEDADVLHLRLRELFLPEAEVVPSRPHSPISPKASESCDADVGSTFSFDGGNVFFPFSSSTNHHESASEAKVKEDDSFNIHSAVIDKRQLALESIKRNLRNVDFLDPEGEVSDRRFPDGEQLKSIVRQRNFLDSASDKDFSELTREERHRWKEVRKEQAAVKKKVKFKGGYRHPTDTYNLTPTSFLSYLRLCDNWSDSSRSVLYRSHRDSGFSLSEVLEGEDCYRAYLANRVLEGYLPTSAHVSKDAEKDKRRTETSLKMIRKHFPSRFVRRYPLASSPWDIPRDTHLPAQTGLQPSSDSLMAIPIKHDYIASLLTEHVDLLSTFGIFYCIPNDRPLDKMKSEEVHRARNFVNGVLLLTDGLLDDVDRAVFTNGLLLTYTSPLTIYDALCCLRHCDHHLLGVRDIFLSFGHDIIAGLASQTRGGVTREDAAAAELFRFATLIHSLMTERWVKFCVEGFPNRPLPRLWVTTIPEIGTYASSFHVYNNHVRKLVKSFKTFKLNLIDWAAAVSRDPPGNDQKMGYSVQETEVRLRTLFRLCRRRFYLLYRRDRNEIKRTDETSHHHRKNVFRHSLDYDHPEFEAHFET